jgi:hypothetical protein
MILSGLLSATAAKAEVTQADTNLNFGRFAGFWVYKGCEEANTRKNCWFIVERKKELYGDNEYFSYAMQRAIPAKSQTLKTVCDSFNYNTGMTVSNLPNNAICIKLNAAGDEAELYFPKGYTGHGTYQIKKSSKEEFMRRVDERSDELRKKTNW